MRFFLNFINNIVKCLKKAVSKIVIVIALFIGSYNAQAGDVTLYAAASLTDVLTELSNSYQKENPDVVIKKSYAGSSTLAKHIENGASADIFISADNDWSDYLQGRGLLLTKTRTKLCSNDLVLIAPIDRDVKIALISALDFSASFNGRLCTGDVTSVPAGKYAKQALRYYGWWDDIATRVVGAEDVRTALAFVARGECGLGIVYKTDAQLSNKVKIVAVFPADSHAAIEYSGALTKKAGADAKSFWLFLQSDSAKAVFTRYGFILPN